LTFGFPSDNIFPQKTEFQVDDHLHFCSLGQTRTDLKQSMQTENLRRLEINDDTGSHLSLRASQSLYILKGVFFTIAREVHSIK